MNVELATLIAYFCLYAVGYGTTRCFRDCSDEKGMRDFMTACGIGFMSGMVFYTVLILVEVFK